MKVLDAAAVTDRVRGLAQFVTEKKKAGRKFVLMLGAGASLSSGIKLTRTIMQEIVDKYAPESAADGLDDAFDKLWRESNPDNREIMLAPYLNGIPSSGYARLAELVQLGFFDMVVTFNFDRLLEKALDDAGFHDYKTVIRGETDIDAVPRLMKNKDPRVKILKIHGSLRSADYFLFSKDEMLNYPEAFRSLFNELTSSDIIICGYAFADNCVIRAFNDSKDSGSIYYVNPSGATESIKGYLIVRHSQDKVISGEVGKFDRFFETLHQQLTRPVEKKPEAVRHNLFKFLDHYDEENKNWFFGRRKLTRTLIKKFDAALPRNLVLSGNPKVGKTSFVRAGLTPYLDKDRYECVFIRCRGDLDKQVQSELVRRFPALAGADWKAPLSLTGITSKRVVIFLDQFERPARFYEQTPDRQQAVFDFVKYLCAQQGDQIAVVFVAVDDKSFWKMMTKLVLITEVIEIEPLSTIRVGTIIKHAARRGGLAIDAKTIAALCARYQEGLSNATDKRAFTLMHVQTFCYYLAKGYEGTVEDDVPNQGLLVALSSISDKTSLIDLLDELPSSERKLIRSFLKVICDPRSNTKKIVEFIKDHFPDFQEDRFPEPIQ